MADTLTADEVIRQLTSVLDAMLESHRIYDTASFTTHTGKNLLGPAKVAIALAARWQEQQQGRPAGVFPVVEVQPGAIETPDNEAAPCDRCGGSRTEPRWGDAYGQPCIACTGKAPAATPTTPPLTDGVSRINREAYQSLLAEDLEWLATCPRTLERDHIEAVLVVSEKLFYGVPRQGEQAAPPYMHDQAQITSTSCDDAPTAAPTAAERAREVWAYFGSPGKVTWEEAINMIAHGIAAEQQARQAAEAERDDARTLLKLVKHITPLEMEELGAAREVAKRAEAAEREVERLRTRLLSAAGDDLCRLTQEEIKAMSSGAVKIPPKEEFLASCERFHAQVASNAGVLDNCLTLAQLVAENEHLQVKLDHAKKRLDAVSKILQQTDNSIFWDMAKEWLEEVR